MIGVIGLLLEASLDQAARVAEGLDRGPDEEQVRAAVDARPRPDLIFQVFHVELDIRRSPQGLDGGDVGPDDACAGVLLSSCAI